MATETIVYASPRIDKVTGERGYWVEDFDGAEAGMTVTVRLRRPRSHSRDVCAKLVRRITASTTGGPMWIAVRAQAPDPAPGSQNDDSAAEVGSGNGHTPAESVEAGQGPGRFHSLEQIISEAQNLPGWIAKDIDTEWADGRCVRARIRLESEEPISGCIGPARSPTEDEPEGF